jgi:dipeptidyl aminopeptidase/acylaminoacyl peptidase
VGLQTTGTATALVQGILMEARDGAAQYSISRNGTLAYIPTGIGSSGRKLVWVSRDGAATPLPAPPRAYETPRLSPDGRRVAASIAGDAPNIFVYDIAANRLTQVTSQADNALPVWTPDGKRVLFRSTKAGAWNVFWKNADGSGEAEQLTKSEYLTEPSSVSPDGQLLLFVRTDPQTRRDVWALPLTGDRKERPVLQSPADDSAARFSPDGRWIAYAGGESGSGQIWVQPFPTTGQKWQISTDGGREPVWAPNGAELFWRDEKKLMAAEIKTQPSFAASKPRLLFEGPYEGAISSRANYDISPDGRRFLMVEAGAPKDAAAEVKIVPNWFEEVKRRVPSSGQR